ncbi:MAG TPA: MFS transporter [Pseudonocardiaceae bacterium]
MTANAEKLAVAAPQQAPSWGTLPIVLAGVFMTTLDFFIVNVAIPATQRDLHASTASIQFVIAGYGIAFAALLITGGRLGDLYGRRRMFSLGVALFTLASLASGLAPTAGFLVGARIGQGVAAALLTPQVLAIIGTTYTGAARAKAFNAYGVALGFAAVFGQLIGGALISANIAGLSWRVIFLINVPIGLVALALTPRLVPASRPEGSARLDIVGTVLVTVGLVAIVLPLVEGRELGWPAWSWVCLVAAAPILAVFAGYQRRLGNRDGAPLIDLTLFGERTFSAGMVTTLVYFLGMGSFFFVLALFLQQGHGLSALDSGLLFIPVGLTFFLASSMAEKLVAKLGRQVLAVGSLVVAVGYGVLALTAAGIGAAGPTALLTPGLLIAGFGMGMVVAPLSATVLAGVTPQHAAAASGVLSTAQEAGGALGIAVVGTVFFGLAGRSGDSQSAFEVSLLLLIGCFIVVAALVQLFPLRVSEHE